MIELKRIQRYDLRRLYEIEYSSKRPKWKEYDAPYFDDFEFKTYDEFITSKEIEFFLGERVKGIYFNDSLIGIVSKYWENEKTRWLEIGIVIFDDKEAKVIKNIFYFFCVNSSFFFNFLFFFVTMFKNKKILGG